MSDFWVFGYGSLMWRPGFSYLETMPALLAGAHRSLCVYSWVHRGTRQRPGLVLGLDRGGSCRGAAFRVDGGSREKVIAYLRGREMVTAVYHEAWRPIRLLDPENRTVSALAYLVDRGSAQYAGRLPRERILADVAASEGRSGPNADYVISTAGHLDQLGIRDPMLAWLAGELRSGRQRQ